MLAEPSPGRYRLHDLISERARQLAASDSEADQAAAVDRLLSYYLHTSRVACGHMSRRMPAGQPIPPERQPAHVPDVTGMEDAAEWMSSERVNLHAAAVHASVSGRHGYATGIPAAIHGYLRHTGYLDEATILHQMARDVARRIGDQSRKRTP